MKEASMIKRKFEEVLTDRQLQAEFDRRVAKALDTAKLRWKKEQNDLVRDIVIKQEEVLKRHHKLVEQSTRKACYEEFALKQLELDIRLELVKNELPDEAYVLVWENDYQLATQKVLLLKKLLNKWRN